MQEPSSDENDAQGRSAGHADERSLAARELFSTGSGKVTYCPGCRRIAVDFAGFHLLFRRDGYDGFLTCLHEAVKDVSGPERPEEILIGPRGRNESIKLLPCQAAEMALFMEMAALVMDAEHPQ